MSIENKYIADKTYATGVLGNQDIEISVDQAEKLMLETSLRYLTKADCPLELLPDVISLAGIARSDTGVLGVVFGLAREVIDSHMQVDKTNRRIAMAKLLGSKVEYARRDLTLGPVKSHKNTEVLKETWGISTLADYWNQIVTLDKMNYPQEKVKVVLTAREPLAAYDSAKRVWGEENVTVGGIVDSYRQLWKVTQYCIEHNLILVPYTHEIAAQLGSEEVVKRIFDLLGLTYKSEVVCWPDDKGYESVTTTYEIPPERFVKGAKSKNAGGWGGFYPQPNGVKMSLDLKAELISQLSEAYAIYDEFAIFARKVLIG